MLCHLIFRHGSTVLPQVHRDSIVDPRYHHGSAVDPRFHHDAGIESWLYAGMILRRPNPHPAIGREWLYPRSVKDFDLVLEKYEVCIEFCGHPCGRGEGQPLQKVSFAGVSGAPVGSPGTLWQGCTTNYYILALHIGYYGNKRRIHNYRPLKGVKREAWLPQEASSPELRRSNQTTATGLGRGVKDDIHRRGS